MKFTKMQGCGNDYVYVNCLEKMVENPSETAKRISNRNFGIGSDGLILICPSETADFKMRMFNADGSEGVMCGNGTRCIGKYVYDFHLTDKTKVTLETNAGIKHLELTVTENQVTEVKVDMGAPSLEAKEVPVLYSKERIVNEEITIGGMDYHMTCVSMGNPHAVVFVEDTNTLDLEKIGPLFEHHPMFPELVNTEFVQVLDRKHIRMRVWERGSGETLACGTGACASVVACILNRKTEEEVSVELMGGILSVYYDSTKNAVFMTGPAVTVFQGEIEI